MRRLETGILAGLLLLTFIVSDSADKLKYRVRVDDGYNALFTRTEGWTGGDVASTVSLSPESTLWLFGDSWVGPVVENRHRDAVMINNAAAIQKGKAAAPDGLTFYFGSKDAKPAPLFVPPDGRGFFWPTRAGIGANGRLYLAAARVFKKENDPSVFAFQTQGNFLLVIANPLDEPARWQVEIRSVPFFDRDAAGTEIDFGAPQFVRDGFVYIYGVEYNLRERNRFMLLARAPERAIADFEAWEFYSKGLWQKEFRQAGRLCDRFGAEFSVSYQPFIKKYVAVYSELGMSDKIMLRTADRPEGPWGPPEVIYRTPEAAWDKSYFCYAAKGHPELSGAMDLLVSYLCNSTDFWKMAADARIYRPKFIRIEFAK